MKKYAIIAVLAVAALSVSLFAQGGSRGQGRQKQGLGEGRREGREAPLFLSACKAEIEADCADVQPGKGAIIECLKESGSLSEGCKAALPSGKEGGNVNMAAPKKACAADVEKFCSDVEPGPGIPQCLNKHKAELSEGCKTSMPQGKEGGGGNMAAGKKACAADVKKFCSNVEPGAGILECLASHKAELSETCAANFKGGKPAGRQPGGRSGDDEQLPPQGE